MKKEIVFSHYWVTNFGWENTVFLPEDFTSVEEFGTDKETNLVIFICINDRGGSQIIKGYYKS